MSSNNGIHYWSSKCVECAKYKIKESVNNYNILMIRYGVFGINYNSYK